jgi:hypothetical protein
MLSGIKNSNKEIDAYENKGITIGNYTEEQMSKLEKKIDEYKREFYSKY